MDRCEIGDIINIDVQDIIISAADGTSKQNENSNSENVIITEFVERFEDQPENELKDLICNKFGFEEMVYKRVVDNEFDIESLLVVTESEINDLFPAPLLGTRAKFKYHLSVWRRNLPSYVSDACKAWIENNCTTSTPNTTELYSTISSPTSSHAYLGDETRIVNDITLQELLRKTEKGQCVLEYFEKKHCLDEKNRELLVSIIVGSYVSCNKGMNMRDIEAATNAVHCLFPSESKEYYLHKRGRGLNPTGKLHDKAVNARIKLRGLKRQLIDESKDQETSVRDSLIDECSLSTEEPEQTIIWLTHNNEPWSEVQTKWTAVFQQRHIDIKTDGLNVLTKWPLFKHSLGHTLVEIDYDILNPSNKSQLFQLWPAFVTKLIPILQQKIKDKASLVLLKELENSDTNSRDFLILSLLHAVLKPPVLSIGKRDTKKSKWKPSIKDAQDSCLIYCQSVSDYADRVESLRQKYLTKGLTLQPLIIGIGKDKQNLDLFYTFYDGILYKFPNLLKCVDITFKLFHVMNFNYPKEGKNFYSFIESFFYNFGEHPNANINSLIKSLRE